MRSPTPPPPGNIPDKTILLAFVLLGFLIIRIFSFQLDTCVPENLICLLVFSTTSSHRVLSSYFFCNGLFSPRQELINS